MRKLVTPFLMLLLFSCSVEELPETIEVAEVQPDVLQEKIIDGAEVYQGDMLFRQEKSTGRTTRLWKDNKVYYSINPNLPNKERVYEAIDHWKQNVPGLQFIERTSEANYIYFTPGSGCSSYVGMVGGRQNINLADACTAGNTIHEIGHAVGLWHEQSRSDRDKYVTVQWDNIQDGRDYNFETYKEAGYDGADYTDHLDFNSIMLYSSYVFSKNGQPTIVKTNGYTYGTQRYMLSDGDIQGVQAMYKLYQNGRKYTVMGLEVTYYYGYWYYTGKYGFRRVLLINGTWYYV